MTASSNMQVPIVVSASEAMVQQNAGVPPEISLWSSSRDYFCRNTSLQATASSCPVPVLNSTPL